jgi:hypothetical protein
MRVGVLTGRGTGLKKIPEGYPGQSLTTPPPPESTTDPHQSIAPAQAPGKWGIFLV